MNFDIKDMEIWEEAKQTISSLETITWLFGRDDAQTIMIVDLRQIRNVRLTAVALDELAVFDILGCFFESLPQNQEISNIQALIKYHMLLRRKATDVLLQQSNSSSDSEGLETPSLLWPWLRRTFCLLSHDDKARETFRSVSCPSRLLEFAVKHIIAKPEFQQLLRRCASWVVNGAPFQWCHAFRSWELKMFRGMTTPVTSVMNDPRQRGIFFLPHEVVEQRWMKISNAGDADVISRKIGLISVHYSSHQRLVQRDEINDEIISAYASMMVPKNGTIVVSTYLWPKLSGTDDHLRIVRNLLSNRVGGKKTTKTVPDIIKSWKKIIFPVHYKKSHWLVVTLLTDMKVITLMDSLPGYTKESGRSFITKTLKDKLELKDWSVTTACLPTQSNMVDCGVFSSQFMKFEYFGASIPKWGDADVKQLRDMMVLEISECSLRWHHSEG